MTFEDRYQKAHDAAQREVIEKDGHVVFPFADFRWLGLFAYGFRLLEDGLRREDLDIVMRGFVFISAAAFKQQRI